MSLLDVRDLTVEFDRDGSTLRAVDGLSYVVRPGEILAIVGESGSGKTQGALALLGLNPTRKTTVKGTIIFEGKEHAPSSNKTRRAASTEALRGTKIGMVFQDPMTALNPVLSVERQLTEGLRRHLPEMTRAGARARAVELMQRVGIPTPDQRLRSYPHELSGGQRQRLMIAMALACEPRLLIADEPTTALDVTIQAQIVDLILDLRRELGMAVLWITHDLALVSGFADRVAVMYAGRIVEEGPCETVLTDPRHAYTAALLASMPEAATSGRLQAIKGTPPSGITRPLGCAFAPRCSWATEGCRAAPPAMISIALEDGSRRSAACIFAERPPWRSHAGGEP